MISSCIPLTLDGASAACRHNAMTEPMIGIKFENTQQGEPCSTQNTTKATLLSLLGAQNRTCE